MSEDAKSALAISTVAGLLTLAFAALKLAGFIDWSWWWVLSPPLFAAGDLALLLSVLAVVALASK